MGKMETPEKGSRRPDMPENFPLFPLNLDLRDRPCLVAGGGRVAERKIRTLLACGARAHVVSPEIRPALEELARSAPALRLSRRAVNPEDLNGVFLAFAATSRRDVNAALAAEARRQGIFCNIADDPARSDFTLPAVIRRGDLQITLSTGGQSPALSRHLRRELEGRFGPEYAVCLRLLGRARRDLLARGHDPAGHRDFFRAVLNEGLVETVRDAMQSAGEADGEAAGEQAGEILLHAMQRCAWPDDSA